MFCTQCGEKIDDGSRFCTGCGAKVDGIPRAGTEQNTAAAKAAPDVTGAAGLSAGESAAEAEEASAPPAAGGEPLIKYTLQSTGFRYTDVNGNLASAGDIFKRPTGIKVMQGAAIALAALGSFSSIGAAAGTFIIAVQLFKDKIRFIRGSMMGKVGKPTDVRLEVNGSDIAAVERADSFLNKAITVTLRAGDKYSFEAPKKHRDNIVNLLNDMIQ